MQRQVDHETFEDTKRVIRRTDNTIKYLLFTSCKNNKKLNIIINIKLMCKLKKTL